MPRPDLDLLVLGAGPAALGLATAAAAEGMRARVVAPAPEARWAPRFGAWQDEIEGLFPEDPGVVADTWIHPLVGTAARPSTALDRRYARLSTPRLQRLLLDRCLRLGVDLEPGRAVAVEHEADGSRALLEDGRALPAPLVVDATGGGALLQPGRRWPSAFQSAYGALLRVDGHPWAPGEMVLMDWRSPAETSGRPSLVDPDEERLPSFLYALPLGRDLVFVEETVLVRPAPVPMAALQGRLRRRLAALGVQAIDAYDEERCLIRMGGGLPALGQRTLGFGAAAGMVHPATGYHLARALREAPALARAIAQSTGDPAERARQAWEALWPSDRLRRWELYRFGAGVLSSLDRGETMDFFDAFFSLPRERWGGFLDGSAATPELLETMSRFFLAARPPVRRGLARAAVGRSGLDTLLRVVGA